MMKTEDILKARKDRLDTMQWMRKVSNITWTEWANEMGIASGSLTSTTYTNVVSDARLIQMAEALYRIMNRRERLLQQLQVDVLDLAKTLIDKDEVKQ